MYSKRKVRTLIAASAVALLALFTTSVEAKKHFTINNCDSSHHQVRVQTANSPGVGTVDSIHVHSGESGETYCNTSPCYLYFKSGGEEYSKLTSDSTWYVHVKANHTITYKTYDFCD
ncbi:hypothetical protein [Bauldia sp.]|uniref:hypothetical protein n=1 Tax=Bauldia sp. TaxID=2575872 RepID=UPI003BAAA8C5